MNILVVDDNPYLSDMLTKFLKLQKYTCHTTSSGQIALSMIESGLYDLVFLDLAMPGFTGYDVINSLKTKGIVKNQKIIVLTAVALNKSDIKFLLKQGVHVVLQKPVPLHELVDYVSQSFPTPYSFDFM